MAGLEGALRGLNHEVRLDNGAAVSDRAFVGSCKAMAGSDAVVSERPTASVDFLSNVLSDDSATSSGDFERLKLGSFDAGFRVASAKIPPRN